jgi:hypothetical protein
LATRHAVSRFSQRRIRHGKECRRDPTLHFFFCRGCYILFGPVSGVNFGIHGFLRLIAVVVTFTIIKVSFCSTLKNRLSQPIELRQA